MAFAGLVAMGVMVTPETALRLAGFLRRQLRRIGERPVRGFLVAVEVVRLGHRGAEAKNERREKQRTSQENLPEKN